MAVRLFQWFVCCCCWLLLGLPAFAAPPGKGWQPGFNLPGLNGPVMAVSVRSRRDLVAAGRFTDAGGQLAADGAAHWNGRTWQALGQGPGIGSEDEVRAALCLPDGSVVLAIQVFTDTASFAIVTRWDGHRWQRLGAPFPFIPTLAVAANGEILAGFVTGQPWSLGHSSRVVRWDRQRWQPLSPNGSTNTEVGNSISELLVLPDGDLVAFGYSVAAPGQYNQVTSHWNGTTWQRLGPDANQPHYYQGLVLAASGDLVQLSDKPTLTTRWDGRAWQPLAVTLRGEVDAISVAPLTRELRATGRFRLPGDTTLRRLARWDGNHWRPALPPTGALATVPNGRPLASLPSGEVLVDTGRGLVWWNGKTRKALADSRQAGLNDDHQASVRTLAVNAKGYVFLTGNPRETSDGERYGLSRWNGRRRPVGPGFSGRIFALATASNGDIVAGGSFKRITTHDTIQHVARWQGRRWQPVGAGLPRWVYALAIAPNGDLLAGGPFGVDRWNGRSWQHLGPPVPAPNALTCCYALAIAPNGDVLAGGFFGVARWNGSSWQVLGGGLNFVVRSLALAPNGDVIAGGGNRYYYSVHSSPAGYVSRWNGSSWQALGPELNGEVNALAVAANGDVVIGGGFEDAGQVNGEGGNPAAGFVARWHDGTWQSLGAGLNREVEALVVAPNGDIVVGGRFTATNDGLAMWHFGIYRDQ